jgi:hypothetical protein
MSPIPFRRSCHYITNTLTLMWRLRSHCWAPYRAKDYRPRLVVDGDAVRGASHH